MFLPYAAEYQRVRRSDVCGRAVGVGRCAVTLNAPAPHPPPLPIATCALGIFI